MMKMNSFDTFYLLAITAYADSFFYALQFSLVSEAKNALYSKLPSAVGDFDVVFLFSNASKLGNCLNRIRRFNNRVAFLFIFRWRVQHHNLITQTAC